MSDEQTAQTAQTGTVYVTQNEKRFDLSDLDRFGVPQHVFTREIYPDTADEQIPEAMKRAYNVLKNFVPANDFICLVGSPLYQAMCMYVLGDLGKLPVRLLRFDRQENRYYPIKLQ